MQRRHLGIALAAALLATAGPPSDSASRPDRHWQDTGADRQYALDALSLKYLRDYTRDEAVVSGIAGLYWCGTPVLSELQSGRLPRSELTDSALRHRAQSLVQRYASRQD